MSRRFSQFFVTPSWEDSHLTNFPSDDDNDVVPLVDTPPSHQKKARKRDTLKNFFSFGGRSSSSSSYRPIPPPKDRPLSIQIASHHLLSRPQPQPHHPSTPPPSRHDSAIGSENSSIKSLPQSIPLRTSLPPSQTQTLHHILDHLSRSLHTHSTISSSLSTNILALMSTKESHIKSSPRLPMDWKIGLLAEMDLVRSELRALFTKKATVVQRSLGVLERMKEGDLEVIGWGVGKLQRDSVMQGALSEGVVDAVTRKCWRRRWVGSGSGGQGVEMRRFVGFVVGRVAKLHECTKEMEGLVEGLERLRKQACRE